MFRPTAEIARTELLTKCPTNPRWKHCPLQDAIRAAGLSVRIELQWRSMDAVEMAVEKKASLAAEKSAS